MHAGVTCRSGQGCHGEKNLREKHNSFKVKKMLRNFATSQGDFLILGLKVKKKLATKFLWIFFIFGGLTAKGPIMPCQ